MWLLASVLLLYLVLYNVCSDWCRQRVLAFSSRDENKMSIPGFTAESSVFKSGCFRSTQPFAASLTYESQVVVPARTTRQICLPIVRCSSTGCWVEPCGIVIVVPGGTVNF
jgi:hypothetical protein